MELVSKVFTFLVGYRTIIACIGGILTGLATVLVNLHGLMADGFQVTDISKLIATPEYAVLVLSVQQFYQRLATKRLHDKIENQTPVEVKPNA